MAIHDIVHTLTIRGRSEGFDKITADIEHAKKSIIELATESTRSSRRQLSVGTDYDRLVRQVDAAANSQAKMDRATSILDRALGQGRIGVDEYNKRLDQAAQRFGIAEKANDNLTKKIGLQRHEWINLSRQMQDVVTMGAMGASPGQIITSQAAQIFDIFSSAQAGPMAALRAVAPLAGAVTGLAATFGLAGKAAWDYASSQEAIEKSLIGVGKASGATVQGINRIADETADAAKLSVASTREMIAGFASSGKIGSENFSALSIATARYAKATGMDLPEASAKMTQAMRDPVKGAWELNERLGFLNGTTLTTIERQVALGDRTGATRTLINAMSGTLDEAASHTNAWSAAIDAVTRKLANLYDLTGRKVMSAIAPTDEQKLQSLTEQRGKLSDLAGRGSWWSGLLTIGADKEIAELDDRIADLQERIRRRSAQATADARKVALNEVSLQNKSIIDAMTPNTTEMRQLQTWKTSLEAAMRLGQGTTQTEGTLKRINDLLAAGGQAARDMLRDARTAADQAGMLSVPRARAQVEEDYRRRVEAANGDDKLLGNARDIRAEALRGIDRQTSFVPQRDFQMRLDEMGRSLAAQREAFGQSTEVAETLRARVEMLNEAAQNGQSVTERFGAGWERAAADMGKAKAAADELTRAQQNVTQGLDEQRSGTRSAITGLVGDVARGKDPRQGLLNAAWRANDQLVDRLISRPITEGLLGRDGTGASGMFGGLFAKMLGSGMQTANMSVSAANVVINGGLGGLGIPGLGSPAGAGQGGVGTQAEQGNGSLLALLGLGGAAAASAGATLGDRTLVRDSSGRVLSYATGGGSGGLPTGAATPVPDQSDIAPWPVSPVTAAALDPARPQTEWDRLISNITFPPRIPGVPLNGSMDPTTDYGRRLTAGLETQAEALRTAGNSVAGALDLTKDAIGSSGSGVADALTSVTKALGNVGSGGFGFGGIFGNAQETESMIGFAGGGFTGRGGRYDPAGVVHRGEYVFSAPAVNRIGVGTLEAMHHGLPGFAEGGIVGAPIMAPQPVSMPPMLAAAAPSPPSASHDGPQQISLQVDVTGARGNAEIMDMVHKGIAAGLEQYDRKLNRSLSGRLADHQRRFG